MKHLLSSLLPVLFLFLNVGAQPGTNDTTFNTIDPGYSNGLGPDGQIRAVAIQNDGKVIVGGFFTEFNEQTINRIARINEGVLDTSFNVGSGFNDYVQCIAIQSDGKILVGGDFTSYNGVTRNRIARLNADGSLDMGFIPNNGASHLVRSIAIQSDGKIVIAGNFTNYNGTGRNRIARLNSNGSLDNSYNPGTGFNGAVYAIDIQSNDKIVAAGAFTLFSGAVRERIARLKTDGTLDASFSPGFGFDNTLYSMTLAPNGNIVAGGDFGSFNGTARNKIAMVDSTGNLVTSFNPGSGFNQVVYSLRTQADGKILAGGSFTTYKGSTENKIIRLDTLGNKDTTFITGSGFGSAGALVVYSIQTYPGGRIVAGGDFSEYDGKSRNEVARLFSDGTLDLSLNMYTGFSGEVRSIVVQNDGKILAGGDFKFFNGVERSGIARLNPDGTLDTTFDIGLGFNYNNVQTNVHALLIQPDDKILVGGDFFTYNGIAVGGLIRLHPDGALDTTFNAGAGVGAGAIYQMVLQNNGKIIIGGSFHSYDGVNTNSIARINPDGSRDVTFDTGTFPNAGFDHDVKALALQPDGKILAGGGFSKYKTTFVSNRIVRINPDGNIDPGFVQNNGFNGVVEAVALQPDGKIVVGGTFTNFDTTPRNGIARVETDGSLDATFYPGSNGFFGAVNELIVQGDTQIIAAGAFTTYNLVNHNRIIRLNPNGTVDNGINFNAGFPDDVKSIALQADGKILAGGIFTSFDNYGRNRIARINNNCVPNFMVINTAACDSFMFNSQTYDTSGTYQQKFTNAFGCDSTIILDLTINGSTSSSLAHSACDTFTFLGQQHTSSGVYNHVLPNSAGCDSMITLNLTINESTSSSLAHSACDMFTFLGQQYTSSGVYNRVLSNSAGCDSTITLNLTIFNSTTHTITTSACRSYMLNGQTYTSSGTYNQVINNTAGCDSIITLDLTIINVDTNVTPVGNNTLEANATGATYQWIDCDNIATPEISGATNRTLTATKDGRYAVRITQNGCTDTSNCYVIKTTGINETFIGKVKLHPNPASSAVTLITEVPLADATIRLITIDGKLIGEEKGVTGTRHAIDLTNHAPGIYMVEIKNQNKVLRIKLVKE